MMRRMMKRKGKVFAARDLVRKGKYESYTFKVCAMMTLNGLSSRG